MTTMTKTAWVYGGLPPLNWDAECEREAAAGQVALWNKLVEIERVRRAAEDAIYRTGDLAPIMDRLDAIEARLEEIPRRAATEEERAERKALFDENLTLWGKAKPLREQVRADNETEFRALYDTRYASIAQARRDSGLWWGNYNSVCAAFDVAVARLGPREMVRSHAEHGDARLTNQIQGGVPAGVWLQSGHSQLKLEWLPPLHQLNQRGAGKRGLLRLLTVTVASSRGSVRKTVSLPIVWHRPLPEGAIIKGVVVQRRRIAPEGYDPSGRPNHDRWQVIFTVEHPLPDTKSDQTFAGIDIGWRLVAGGLRVATIAGDGGVEHIVLPKEWLDRQQQFAEMRGWLRKATDAGEDLVSLPPEWLQRHPQWRRKYGDSMPTRLLAQMIKHGMDKRLLQRREIYRVAASKLAQRFGFVAIDASIKPLTRRKLAGEVELPPMVRRMRTWSSPSELVGEIERAIKRLGGQVLYARGKSTLTCWRCGHVNNPPEAARVDLVWRCEGCKALWDQDENAARVLLAAAQKSSAVAAIKLVSKENKGLKRTRMTRKKKPADSALIGQTE